MNPKKKFRRCRGLGLDLAISRFIYSFGQKYRSAGPDLDPYQNVTDPEH
jgi:hypothetical protein